MTKRPLRERLHQAEFGINIEEILNGKLEAWVNEGLQGLFICNDGSGRSRNTAKELTFSHKILSARLEGGFNRISKPEIDICRGYLFNLLCGAELPYLGLVLTSQEIQRYNPYINQLRIFRYQRPEDAVQSVVSMHKRLRS